MFLASKLALLARLTGQPVSDVAMALQTQGQSVGNLDVGDHQVERPVIVYPFDIAGTSSDSWPCVSVYAVNRVERRDESFVYRDDLYGPVKGSKVTVTVEDGTQVTGYSLRKRRPYPRPVDYTWAIRIWARDEDELFLLEERVFDALGGARGGLRLTQNDGVEVVVDTEIDANIPPVMVPAGLFEAGGLGEFSHTLMYRVEAYQDADWAKQPSTTIQQRVFEVEGDTTEDGPTTSVEPDSVTSA